MTPMTPPFHYMPGEFFIKEANEAWELSGCAQLRRQVFCVEQQLFDRDDGDLIDSRAISIAALACVMGQPDQVVGVVRIHETKPGHWFGSRLAVQAEFRSGAALGQKLIQHAVCTANARGARQFRAHVQLQNARFFARLHWQALSPSEVCGQPHLLMQADLAHYPPHSAPRTFYSSALRVA